MAHGGRDWVTRTETGCLFPIVFGVFLLFAGAIGGACATGPVDASDATVTQTTIGTIQLTSGWLWGPVGLLVMVALQRDRKARWAGRAALRCISTIDSMPKHFRERSDFTAFAVQQIIEQWVAAKNRPRWWDWGDKDGPERVINKAVNRLKKEKT